MTGSRAGASRAVGKDASHSVGERIGTWWPQLTRQSRPARHRPPTVPLEIDAPDEAAGPEQDAETQWLRQAIMRAVAALPAGQREAAYLYYLQGLTQRQVASELQISPGAVKTACTTHEPLLDSTYPLTGKRYP